MPRGRKAPVPPAPPPDPGTLAAFRARVLEHYREHGRDLPWRRTRDPYRVLVSEVMLQQTQVPRVMGAYERFIDAFPTVDALAAAPLDEVLRVWRGMGYNRRAVQLKRIAEIVAVERGGEMPRTQEELRALPGVGPATAAALAAFAYGEAHPYIETNVRAAFLHDFFCDRDDVPDREIMPLVEATLDRDDPRTWYYALMDYGTHLKQTLPNPCRRSAHHARQSRFEGSTRQLRGRLLRALLEGQGTAEELAEHTGASPERARAALDGLARDGLAEERSGTWRVRREAD